MSIEIEESTVTAYLETLLWTSTLSCEEGESVMIEGDEYEDGTPLDQVPGCDVSDLSEELRTEAREDLESFAKLCAEEIGICPFTFFEPSQVAHDFALSRNGHGAGFFDREYTVTCTGPGGRPANDHFQRYSKARSGEGVAIQNELQDCARTFGTHGLMAWVDAETGTVKIESHG